MKQKALAVIASVLMAFSAASFEQVSAVYAAGFAETEIPVSCVIPEGVPKEKCDFEFSLISDLKGQPMPGGSDENVKRVNMNGSGKVKFGKICFDHPEIYSYTVRETTEEWDNFRRDHKVYKVELMADTDGKVHMVIRNGKGEKVDRIVFRSRYMPGDAYDSPKMGDSVKLLPYLVMLIPALALLIFTLSLKRRRCRRKEFSGGDDV